MATTRAGIDIQQRAFEEWLPKVPNLDFEFLFYGSIGHFYTPVHHLR